MATASTVPISPLRLRIGVGMILFWLVPLWTLGPVIASFFSSDNEHLGAVITAVIVVVQTIVGILGFLIAGKEVKMVIKGASMRQAVGRIWFVLIHGQLDSPA